MLNDYQRGNRDGLLNAAAEYEATAEQYRLDIERVESHPGFNPKAHGAVIDRYRMARESCMSVAWRLRKLAEALPEDPEDPA
jgi:hypothetical protein